MEGNRKGELTFGDIFYLLKKSCVRIIVYVLIAVILVGAVGVAVMFATKDDTTYQAVITYNYGGAEEGLNPFGGKLDPMKIKSDAVVNNALNNLGKDIADKQMVISSITISGIVPEDAMQKILTIKEIATKNPSSLSELSSVEYVSTSYVVSLESNKKLNYNEKDYIAVLDAIIDEYFVQFKKKYGFGEVLGVSVATKFDTSAYDYIALYDMFNQQIDEMQSYLSGRIASAKSFRDPNSKMTFSEMYTVLDNIRDYEIKNFESLIMERGIQKGFDVSANDYIAARLRDIDSDIANITSKKTATEAAISNWAPQYNTFTDAVGKQETLANGEVYNDLCNMLSQYNSRLADLQSAKTNWTRWKQCFDDAVVLSEAELTEVKSDADNAVNAISSKLDNISSIINVAVDEYIESDVMNNAVIKTISAVEEKDNTFNTKLLVIVLVIAAVIAFLIAVGITNKKLKKAEEAAERMELALQSEGAEKQALLKAKNENALRYNKPSK